MGKTITLKGDAARAFLTSGSKKADPFETCATRVHMELTEDRKGAMKRATDAIRELVKSEVQKERGPT